MFLKEKNRVEQMDQLIRQKRTGNAQEFADKLNISRRHVYNLIDELNSYGLGIHYISEFRSFVYLNEKQIRIIIGRRDLSEKEVKEINGGIKILKKIALCNFISQMRIKLASANPNEPFRPGSLN